MIPSRVAYGTFLLGVVAGTLFGMGPNHNWWLPIVFLAVVVPTWVRINKR